MTALATLGVLCLAAWILLWIGFGVVSGFVHLLLVVGAVLLIWSAVKRANERAGTRL